jgi:hypothetical protein
MVLAGLIAGLLPVSARAQCAETLFQNYTGVGQVACPCFVAGEQAGAVFTLPPSVYPVEILRVGIGWVSQFGGSGQTVEQAVHIYAGGLPNPGTPVFSLLGPVLTDGAINEFNLAPLPGEIVIPSGPFTVTLEFFNTNVGDPFSPTVVNDGNGCQSGKNVIFAVPGGWLDACSAGVTGDWVFYVKYRSLNVTASASPAQVVFSSVPAFQTTCDTVQVVNTGCDTLLIAGISGCGAAPFSIDTTLTSHTVAPGGSTPIVVCVTPTSNAQANCTLTVASNASNGPTTFDVSLDVVTAVGSPARRGFDIVAVVPNPFNPSTSVRFELPSSMPVTAEVWSVDGGRVRTLAREQTFPAGQNEIRWDGRGARGERVASGVYLFRLTTPLGKRATRLVLLQ